MAKTRQERITSIEEQIARLQNQKKLELQKHRADERKVRTKRLIDRGAILESLIEDAKDFTNDQIHSLLAKVIGSKLGQQILAELREQDTSADGETPSNDEASSVVSFASNLTKPSVEVSNSVAAKSPESTSQESINQTSATSNADRQGEQTNIAKPNNLTQQQQPTPHKQNNNPTNSRNHQQNNKHGNRAGQSG